MTQAGKVIAVTDTPLTDRIASQYSGLIGDNPHGYVSAQFARNLERQLAAATARAEAAEKDAARWNAFIDASVIDNIGRQPGYTHKLLADSRKLVDGVIDAMSKEAANKHVDAAIDAAQGSNP